MRPFFEAFRGLGLALFLVFAAGCVRNQPPPDTVSQVSTINALLAGVYDGDKDMHYLKRHGDFGIGTFNALDGEMVFWQGRVYQVRADGKVYRPGDKVLTPFASVAWFVPEKTVALNAGDDFAAVRGKLDKVCSNKNLFYAVALKGRFTQMKTRSVPKQKKPYPALVKVTAHQPVFKMQDVEGVVIGFRCPPFVNGINVPGWHLHFLSKDRTRGGHVLDFKVASGTADIDELFRFYMTLPRGKSGFSQVDLSLDRTQELYKVEK
jgi:acetolactate decarboxylase